MYFPRVFSLAIFDSSLSICNQVDKSIESNQNEKESADFFFHSLYDQQRISDYEAGYDMICLYFQDKIKELERKKKHAIIVPFSCEGNSIA